MTILSMNKFQKSFVNKLYTLKGKNCALTKFMTFSFIIIDFFEGLAKTPCGHAAVYCITDRSDIFLRGRYRIEASNGILISEQMSFN